MTVLQVPRNAVFVDTSAWVAMLDRSEASHLAVAAFLREQRALLVTSDYVVDETLTFLRLRVGTPIALQFGESLLADDGIAFVRLAEADWKQAWVLFRRYSEHDFSFTDCTSFALMKRLGLSRALTLDGHFRVMGFQMLP
jgi:predicted nucleic acid-binding protein